jgi:hypothetical protein
MRAVVTSAFRATLLVRKAILEEGAKAAADAHAREKMMAVNFILDI